MWTLRHKELQDHFILIDTKEDTWTYVEGYAQATKWSTQTAAEINRDKYCRLPWIIMYEHN